MKKKSSQSCEQKSNKSLVSPPKKIKLLPLYSNFIKKIGNYELWGEGGISYKVFLFLCIFFENIFDSSFLEI